MRRIAIYCVDFYPTEGGYSFAFQNLIRGIVEEYSDIEVDVFTPISLAGHVEIDIERVNVLRLENAIKFRKIPYLRGLWYVFFRPWLQARKITKEFGLREYDFILFESVDDPLVLYCLPLEIKNKVIVRVHGCSETEFAMWDNSFLHRFKSKVIASIFLKSVKYISATSDYYLDFVKRWYICDNQLIMAKKRFITIPNAIIAKAPRLDIDFSDPRRHKFLTLGRMDEMGANQKSFEDILMAIILLSDTHKKSLSITFIGKGSERNRLMKIASNIPFVEFKFIESLPNSEVSEVLFETDCVILASRYEGMSVFAMESLACSCPVIFSNVGGIAEFVKNNGYSFQPGNANELSTAISKIIEHSYVELRNMGSSSRDLISNYTPRIAARKLIDFSTLMH
jgi:glycosyltransferase involved in cell wall biosynthesis